MRHALLIGVWLGGACQPPAQTITRTPCDACDGDCVLDDLPNRGSSHVSGDVAYEDTPPASGDHHACWATWGVHDETVTPEQWVHNLEHGGVVTLYTCTDCVEDVTALTEFVSAQEPGRAVLTAYDDAPMEKPYAIVSWQHRMLTGCVDTVAMQSFFDANVGHGPEDETADPGCVDPPTTP